MTDSPPVRVVIIDDHRMFAQSLSHLLAIDGAIEVVGIASDGQEGLDMVRRHRPRVALVDYQMPGSRDGVEITAEIKRLHPETMVVVLTGLMDERVLVAAIEAGCSGFLTKDRAAGELAQAVHAAAAGEALITPAMLARLLPKLHATTERTIGHDLTARERELLVLLAEGGTSRAIAAQMHLSHNTVRNYVQSVLTKLGAHSKLEAVATAVRAGLIEYPARTGS